MSNKTATKKVVTKVTKKVVTKPSRDFSDVKVANKDTYLLEVVMGADKYKVTGNDHKIFSKIDPSKITNKTYLTFSKGTKSYSFALMPIMVKKLFRNEIVQIVKFKLLSGKVS